METEFDKENRRFIRNGRDLATIAFRDVLYTESFRAALILFTQGALGGSVGPYTDSERQQGFATFGEPHILTAMASASSCLLYTSPSPRDQRGSRMPSSA